MNDMPRDGMTISVIVCTYNRSESLSVTLKSLADSIVPEVVTWELLVVDNNSNDSTRAVVEAFAAAQNFPVRYVFERRQGVSFARNTGTSQARGKLIAFTDDDVMVDPMWIAAVREAFERFQCVGLGGRVLPLWGQAQPKWFNSAGPFRLVGAIVEFDRGDVPIRLDWPAIGANMAFRRDIFDRYGGLRTDLGPSGDRHMVGDDSEFFMRMMNAGEELMYAPQAIVYHPVPPARVRKSYFRAWYFQHGMASAKLNANQLPKDVRRYWGIPRYLFRQCAVGAARWLFCRGSAKRFYYQLQACRALGEISEFHRSRG